MKHCNMCTVGWALHISWPLILPTPKTKSVPCFTTRLLLLDYWITTNWHRYLQAYMLLDYFMLWKGFPVMHSNTRITNWTWALLPAYWFPLFANHKSANKKVFIKINFWFKPTVLTLSNNTKTKSKTAQLVTIYGWQNIFEITKVSWFKLEKLHLLLSSCFLYLDSQNCINILTLISTFDSKRIKIFIPFQIGDPTDGPYYLLGLICCKYLSYFQ